MVFRPPSLRDVTPQGQGRFPGYDVLDELRRTDSVTAGVVLARLDPKDQLNFFTPREQGVATALVALILDQHEAPSVPVIPMIDERLRSGETDGYVYEGMPDDGEAWRRSLAGLDDDAQQRFGSGFPELALPQQGELLSAVQSASGQWHGMPASRVWGLWTRYACAEFYSHPWAWNEIGFGGPAYPRGYKSTGVDKRENWEVPDSEPADPVTAGRRIEAARARHARAGGQHDHDHDGDGGIPRTGEGTT